MKINSGGTSNDRNRKVREKKDNGSADISSSELVEAQQEAKYQAIAYSLSVRDTVVLPDVIREMEKGLP